MWCYELLLSERRFPLDSAHYYDSGKEKAHGVCLVCFEPLELLPCLAAPLLSLWIWANKKTDLLGVSKECIDCAVPMASVASMLHLYSTCSLCLVVVAQRLSCVQLFSTPRTAAHWAPLSSTNSQNLLKFMSIESAMLSVSLSAAPFSFCLQSSPASESFSMSQLFTSGGQSIRVSASAPVLPVNIQGWFPLGLTSLWHNTTIV